MAITIEEQIACVQRELGFRERLYSRWVKTGKLNQQGADEELGRMRAVLTTLTRIQLGHSGAIPNAEELRQGGEARMRCLVQSVVAPEVYRQVLQKVRESRS